MLGLLLSFGAGLLTTLSPCVLPVLPIVLGSAGSRHPLAPAAVAAGMSSAFAVLGVLLASAGASIGLGDGALRSAAALLLAAAGAVLLSERLQSATAAMLAPLAGWAARRAGAPANGLIGHFGLGALLGAVWSPCTGPTLGAAVGLASQAGGGLRAAIVMLVFALGASVPLLAAAYATRGMIARSELLRRIGGWGKPALGAVLAVVGFSVFVGLDKALESALLDALPEAWLDWTTRF